MKFYFLVVDSVEDELQIRYLWSFWVEVGEKTDVKEVRAVDVALFVDGFYFPKQTILLDFFMLEEILEQHFIVPVQKLFKAESWGRLFFIEVIDVEVFIEKSLSFEMGWEKLIFFLEEMHYLVVHWFVVFRVFVKLGNEEVENLIWIVELIYLNNLLLASVSESVGCQPIPFEPHRFHEVA